VLKVEGTGGFFKGGSSYNEKNNLIVACPKNNTVQFYDANTLQSLKHEIPPLELESSVVEMGFSAETDTYIFGCANGHIYTYNVSTQALDKILKKNYYRKLGGIAWVNSDFYAFSSYYKQDPHPSLEIAHLVNKRCRFYFNAHSEPCFHTMETQKLILLSRDCSMTVYKTNQLPKLPVLGSVKAQKVFSKIKSMVVNGKEYIITAGFDRAIKIWHMYKGKIRLLKVIRIEEGIGSMICLEDYKMIATTHGKKYVKFFGLLSGKLEKNFDGEMPSAVNMFLMKDKDMLGVSDSYLNVIKMIKLSSDKDDDDLF